MDTTSPPQYLLINKNIIRRSRSRNQYLYPSSCVEHCFSHLRCVRSETQPLIIQNEITLQSFPHAWVTRGGRPCSMQHVIPARCNNYIIPISQQYHHTTHVQCVTPNLITSANGSKSLRHTLIYPECKIPLVNGWGKHNTCHPDC